METENKKICLVPTSQLLLTPNIVKSNIDLENFQISLGDGVPTEVASELARVNLHTIEWKTIGKSKTCELKIKVPSWCAGKIKEIGLYYSERPQDTREHGTLIAYSYQTQVRHEGEGEELALQLVLPHTKGEEIEHSNNSANSVSTEGTASLNHTVLAADLNPIARTASSVRCYVRDENNRCLLPAGKASGVHQNWWGRYGLFVDASSEDDQTVIRATFPGWPDKYFTVPADHHLVAGESYWSNTYSWKIRQETKAGKLKDFDEELERGKNEKLKEVAKEIDNENQEKLKEPQDRINKAIKDKEQQDIIDDYKDKYNKLLEQLIKEKGEKLKELDDTLSKENKGKREDFDDKLTKEDQLKKLEEKTDYLEKKSNDLEEKLKKLEKKLKDCCEREQTKCCDCIIVTDSCC